MTKKFLLSDNNQLKKIENIKQTTKEDKENYYVMCDEDNTIVASGKTIEELIIDLKQNLFSNS